MPITPLLLFGAAWICTGEATVDPFVGVQMLIDGTAELGEHDPEVDPIDTVAVAVADPPGPVAVSV
jgi:hypothetical protein